MTKVAGFVPGGVSKFISAQNQKCQEWFPGSAPINAYISSCDVPLEKHFTSLFGGFWLEQHFSFTFQQCYWHLQVRRNALKFFSDKGVF